MGFLGCGGGRGESSHSNRSPKSRPGQKSPPAFPRETAGLPADKALADFFLFRGPATFTIVHLLTSRGAAARDEEKYCLRRGTVPRFDRRVRAGDREAAAELVCQYEPEVRRFIRMQLQHSRLRRSFDSADIFQSVFLNFYVRVMGGQFDLEEPTQLLRLLATMARNRITDHGGEAVGEDSGWRAGTVERHGRGRRQPEQRRGRGRNVAEGARPVDARGTRSGRQALARPPVGRSWPTSWAVQPMP